MRILRRVASIACWLAYLSCSASNKNLALDYPLKMSGVRSLLALHIDQASHSISHGCKANLPLNPCQFDHILSRSMTSKDCVHLFESLTLGLGQEEVYKEATHDSPGTEEDVCSPCPRLKHRWNHKGDGKVVHPV